MRIARSWLIAIALLEPGCDEVFGLRDRTVSGALAFTTASAAHTSGSASSLSYPLDLPDGPDRILLVSVMVGANCDAPTITVSGVAYAHIALTRIAAIVGTPCDLNTTSTEQWLLVAPPVGTGDVDVSLTGKAPSLHVAAMAFAGVNQQTPVRASSTARGDGLGSTVSVGSAAGDLVVNVVGQGNRIIAPSGDATLRFVDNASSSTTLDNSAGSTSDGGSVVTSIWSFGSPDEWQTISTSLRPALQ